MHGSRCRYTGQRIRPSMPTLLRAARQAGIRTDSCFPTAAAPRTSASPTPVTCPLARDRTVPALRPDTAAPCFPLHSRPLPRIPMLRPCRDGGAESADSTPRPERDSPYRAANPHNSAPPDGITVELSQFLHPNSHDPDRAGLQDLTPLPQHSRSGDCRALSRDAGDLAGVDSGVGRPLGSPTHADQSRCPPRHRRPDHSHHPRVRKPDSAPGRADSASAFAGGERRGPADTARKRPPRYA